MHEAKSARPPTSGPSSHYVRWKLDPSKGNSDVEPVELINLSGEMPKVDSRYETKPYKYLFLSVNDPTATEPPAGGMYNAIAKCNVDDGTYHFWAAGASIAIHEVAFIPRQESCK
jgi:carotenoid cleavage dioxygenase-like enzyme